MGRDTSNPDSLLGNSRVTPDNETLTDEQIATVESRLGYTFSNKEWLLRALTHRSLQMQGVKVDYERLEFIGDAVFDLAVAHLLLDKYPELREGELSKMRAALVNTNSLAEIARELGIGPMIRLSRGEIASGGADRPSILADVLEALFGGIYREAGYEVARLCINHLFKEKVETVKPTDPKTELQEALHALGKSSPVYELESMEGVEHAPIFVSHVRIGGQIVSQGRGGSKKASQQSAAALALEKLKNNEIKL